MNYFNINSDKNLGKTMKFCVFDEKFLIFSKEFITFCLIFEFNKEKILVKGTIFLIIDSYCCVSFIMRTWKKASFFFRRKRFFKAKIRNLIFIWFSSIFVFFLWFCKGVVKLLFQIFIAFLSIFRVKIERHFFKFSVFSKFRLFFKKFIVFASSMELLSVNSIKAEEIS